MLQRPRGKQQSKAHSLNAAPSSNRSPFSLPISEFTHLHKLRPPTRLRTLVRRTHFIIFLLWKRRGAFHARQAVCRAQKWTRKWTISEWYFEFEWGMNLHWKDTLTGSRISPFRMYDILHAIICDDINQGKMPALSSSNSSLIHTDIPIRDFRCPTHLEVAKMPFIAGWERFIRITVWTRARYRSQPEPPVIGHLIFHLGVGPKGRWENTSRYG